jgi:sulfoquinovosidase
MFSPRFLALTMVACLLGAAPIAYARTLVLGDGTQVSVGATGSIALTSGGRELFATSPLAAPTMRQFDEALSTLLSQFVYTRTNTVEVPFSRYAGARRLRGGGVRIKFRSDRDANGRRYRAALEATVRVPGEVTALEFRPGPKPTFQQHSIALPVRCDPAGTFHGFGEQYNATDQRGEAFSLFVSEQGIGRLPNVNPIPLNGSPHTTYFPMPYYLDARGFGVLVETDRRVEVDLCKTDPNVAWLESVASDPLKLLVFHGPTPLDVIRQLGGVVGRPKAPPGWAYGMWVSAQGGRAAVVARAAQLRAEGVPANVIWSQDWTGVRVNFDGGLGVQYRWTADETHYPDLAGLISGLRTDGFRFLAYVNPFVALNLGHFAPMSAQGLLIKKSDGTDYVHFAPNGQSSEPDLTNPAAREYVKSFLRAMVQTYGIDGWMADFAEWTPVDAVYSDGSDPVANHNRFPIEWHRLTREVMDEVRPTGDWVSFGRSGWTGVQQVSMIHWVGDQETDWSIHDGFPTAVPALINLGLAGVPYVTHDIGGFSGTTAPPRTKELMLRWIELGAFTPFMRTHEGADRNNNWQWYSDAETISAFRRFGLIHQALAPELEALGAAAATTSAPILRHLLLVFPDDVPSRSVHDQFMIGDELLVAPVVTEGAVTRDVYLPPGTWYDVWTGTAYPGGTTVTVNAPLGSPPVFSRGHDRTDLRAIL